MTAAGEPWDLAGIALGTVDPVDRYRPRVTPRPDATARPRPDPRPDPRYAERVHAARAQLALEDPTGEAGAVAPLTREQARRIVIEQDEHDRTRTQRGGPHPDGRTLLDRLGADPTRDAGRVPCPAHGGRDRNLAWRLTRDGTVLLKCHSHQCSFVEIVAAVR